MGSEGNEGGGGGGGVGMYEWKGKVGVGWMEKDVSAPNDVVFSVFLRKYFQNC